MTPLENHRPHRGFGLAILERVTRPFEPAKPGQIRQDLAWILEIQRPR